MCRRQEDGEGGALPRARRGSEPGSSRRLVAAQAPDVRLQLADHALQLAPERGDVEAGTPLQILEKDQRHLDADDLGALPDLGAAAELLAQLVALGPEIASGEVDARLEDLVEHVDLGALFSDL